MGTKQSSPFLTRHCNAPRLVQAALAFALGIFLSGCANQSSREKSHTVYTRPLLSEGAVFGLLPPVIQNTVRAQVGSAEILSIQRVSEHTPLVYRLDFRRHELYPPLFVREDGAVLNPDMSVAVESAAQMHDRLSPE